MRRVELIGRQLGSRGRVRWVGTRAHQRTTSHVAHTTPGRGRASAAGDQRQLAALGDEAAGGVPHLAVLLEEAAGDVPGRNTHRSHPGAGRARTWAVSSSVGVQATGSRALNVVGGKASTASSSPTCRSARSSRSRNHPRTSGSPLGAPVAKPASSGWRRRSTRSMNGGGNLSAGSTATRTSGRRQVGRPGLDPLGTGRRRSVAERAERLQQPLPARLQRRRTVAKSGPPFTTSVVMVAGPAAGREVVRRDGHRVGPPAAVLHRPGGEAEQVAAVGVAADVPAGTDLGPVPPAPSAGAWRCWFAGG